MPKDCVIWSTLSTNRCDEYGSLEFEKYWSQRCDVVIFHLTIFFKGNICTQPPGNFTDHPRIKLIRGDMWGGKCFNCVYQQIKGELNRKVHVLKIQSRGKFTEDFDGVQYTILSDFYLHIPNIVNFVDQIAFTASINSITLTDNVGREAENAWNMWASQKVLSDYASVSTKADPGNAVLLGCCWQQQQRCCFVACRLYSCGKSSSCSRCQKVEREELLTQMSLLSLLLPLRPT